MNKFYMFYALENFQKFSYFVFLKINVLIYYKLKIYFDDVQIYSKIVIRVENFELSLYEINISM